MVISTLPDTTLPPLPGPQFPTNDRQARILAMTEPLAGIAAANASRHDKAGTFPHDTIDALVEAGFHTLTLPEALGGWGATPLETMIALEQLARGDGSVALAICMHLNAIHSIATSDARTGSMRERMLAEVVSEGGLYNTADSEAGLGSPSRGGAFATTATPTGDGGWCISGRKSWTTLSPALRWAGVSATTLDADGEPAGRARFLIPMNAEGVTIDETWDNMSMDATGSHDLVLDNVVVPDDHRLPPPGKPSSSPWSILTSAVYLGVGVAARDFTIAFAKTRKPAAMGGKTIASLPNVQARVAEIEIKLLAARETLYGVVQQWQDHPELREPLGWQMAGAKVLVTNNAIDVTDQALRVVGSVGLQRRHPLERYFRDVRAGLGNPPLDDVAMGIIGRAALEG